MAQRGSWASYVIWGSIAVCAVLAASLTIALVVGAHRGIQVAAPAKRTAPVTQERMQAAAPAPAASAKELAALPSLAPVTAPTSIELARINDALRTLAAERDRLVARLEQIERAVGDITASIKERPASGASLAESASAVIENDNQTAPSGAEQAERIGAAPPPSADAVPSTPQVQRSPSARAGAIMRVPPQPDPTEIFRPYAGVKPLVTPPSPAQAPMQIHAAELQAAPRTTESVTTRTEFAVDLGSESSMDGLRALWANLRGNHGTALASLRPLVAIRDGGRPGATELRLIAGPLANAGAAARTCATLQAKGVACQTTVFDGQRLALR